MMIDPKPAEYFIDTSALVKAYVSETGTDVMDGIWQQNAVRRISSIGLVEAISVFQRLRLVENVLSQEQFALLCANLLSDASSGRLEVLSVTASDIQHAICIEIERYMTAIDAIQVALAAELGEDSVFVSSDEKLNRVVAEMGLRVVNPASHNI